MTATVPQRGRRRQAIDASVQSTTAPDPALDAPAAPDTSSPRPAAPQMHLDPIPGVIPFGSLTMFAGPPGAGKTTLLVDWIRRWLDGATICGKPTNKPTEVGILIADRQSVGTKQWLEAVGIHERVKLYCIAEDNTFPISDLRVTNKVSDIFLRCLERLNLAPGAHLIVDPITPLFIIGDPNKQRDVALSMMHYSRVCQQKSITMTCTGHFSKQTGKKEDRYARPQDRIAGSGAFVGFTDTQMYLLPPEGEQKHHELGWVPRHAAEERFALMRGPDGLFLPYDDAINIAEEQDKENRQCIAAILAATPIDPETIDFKDVVEVITTTIGLRRARIYFYRNWLIEKDMLLVPRRGHISRPLPPEGLTLDKPH